MDLVRREVRIMFWIVVAILVVALLASAWLVDRRFRIKRIDTRNAEIEDARARSAAQAWMNGPGGIDGGGGGGGGI